MTMRAARYLFAAGTIAAALLATAVTGASAATQECIGEAPTVCGHVFTETNGNTGFQVGEGTENISVVVTYPNGTQVPAAIVQPGNPTTSASCVGVQDTADCAYYSFDITEPGDYLVCVVVDGQNAQCTQVSGAVRGQIVDFEVPADEPPPPTGVWGVGTGTPGYWKNHPEAWPGSVTVGGVTYLNQKTAPAGQFTKYDAIKLMGKVGGDKTITMFSSLISAKLNSMLANNTECVTPTIGKADVWMTAHPVGSGVKASSAAWIEGEPWHQLMDDYNNGKLCAPHRD